MRDLIFVSMEDWDDIWRRNQFICAGLACRHPEMRILFVGLPVDISNRLRRGKVNELCSQRTFQPDGFNAITVTRPLKLLPNSIAMGRKINEWMFRSHVLVMSRKLEMRQPILWLNPHSAVHMTGRMEESCVIYDITDDWTTLTQNARLTELIKQQDAELCRKSDAVIVCSERLRQMKSSMAENLHLIPNGVDCRHYARVLDHYLPLPHQASAWAKPVFGYTGTIHPDRVDVSLLETIAGRLQNGSIVLIGPNHLPANDQQRLSKYSNIHMLGPVPYSQIPDYMRAFDVCITPHRQTPFTESLNPIKLWEYLAAGKPIVATDVAGFRDFPQLVSIAHNADEFFDAMQKALHEDSNLRDARIAEARKHSWESRLDQIEAVIENCAKPMEVVHAS